MKAYFKMDKFLENTLNYKKLLKPQHIKNEYPGLIELTTEYKNLYYTYFREHGYDAISLVGGAKDEVYYQKIELPHDDYYYLLWNIPLIKKIILQNNIDPVEIEPYNLIHAVDVSSLENVGLMKAANNDEPVIVGLCSQISSGLVIIDGNHRIYDKAIHNIDTISAYLLMPQFHIEGMSDEGCKLCFKIHNNINAIIMYITGQITKNELNYFLLKM